VISAILNNARTYKYRRIVLFGIVGGFVALIGSILMFLFVDIFHIEQNTGYFIQTIIALQLNFNLNDIVTWGDWRAENGLYWQRWGKYHLARAFTVVLCQVLFYFMIVVGIPHMIAYAVNIAVGMSINYISSDKFVFRKKERKCLI
jgi:putative flippase GtrA